jgi:hypothetical protein
VAIPAKDEATRIGACLSALDVQTAREPFSILVLVNNSSDGTADIVRAFARASRREVHLYDVKFQMCAAPAARARRLSMNAALALLSPQGVVLTTDADSRVDPRWLDANVSALRSGCDLVCGAIAPDIWDADTPFPERVLHRGASEFTYEQMAAELEYLLDPTPWDPWPHHRMETAASLALPASWLTMVGGVPEVEPGEDRALVNLVRREGGRVRHAMDAQVTTSCRLDGRARGGWADDLRERVENPSAPCHDNLEPTLGLLRRAGLRGALRAAWPNVDAAAWAARLRIAPSAMRDVLARDSFGEAWTEIEALSPRLTRTRLEIAALARETALVARVLDLVRARVRAPATAAF